MRAGEILKLTWCDIDFRERTIFAKDPKNKSSRHAYMTDEVEEVLQTMNAERTSERLFLSNEISHTFEGVVAFLGFNEGIEDTMQKVCFIP